MISIIAAMAENRVIGHGNALPWHLPADLRHFKQITTGHAVIMGRRNYESIGRPLPGRRNIVVTSNREYLALGCEVVHSIEAALDLPGPDAGEIFVIGGAEIYRQCLPRAERLYLTLVHASVAGDTYFPNFEAAEWIEVARERHDADAKNPFSYTFLTFSRER